MHYRLEQFYAHRVTGQELPPWEGMIKGEISNRSRMPTKPRAMAVGSEMTGTCVLFLTAIRDKMEWRTDFSVQPFYLNIWMNTHVHDFFPDGKSYFNEGFNRLQTSLEGWWGKKETSKDNYINSFWNTFTEYQLNTTFSRKDNLGMSLIDTNHILLNPFFPFMRKAVCLQTMWKTVSYADTNVFLTKEKDLRWMLNMPTLDGVHTKPLWKQTK